MSSFAFSFPNPQYLLALTLEELAYLLLPYFRSLPWTMRVPVSCCMRRAVAAYPIEFRLPVFNSCMAAWDHLYAAQLLKTSSSSTSADTAESPFLEGTRGEPSCDVPDEGARTRNHCSRESGKGR